MAKAGSLNADLLDATIAVAETTVAHDLGRVPLDGFVLNRTLGGIIYRGPTAWTSTDVFLRSSIAATTITLILF